MRLSRARLLKIYCSLYKAYGPQHWWSASTKFEMMAGAVLVQNTNWNNAARAVSILKRKRLLDPTKLAAMSLPQLATLIRTSGTHRVKARRLRALSIWVQEQGGIAQAGKLKTEELRDSLLAVHGIGPETADCILLYAFDRPVFIADAYARRFLSRFGLSAGQSSYELLREEVELALKADADLYNEYHALIVFHSKHICRAKPLCGRCLLRQGCAYYVY